MPVSIYPSSVTITNRGFGFSPVPPFGIRGITALGAHGVGINITGLTGTTGLLRQPALEFFFPFLLAFDLFLALFKRIIGSSHSWPPWQMR